MTDRQLLQKLGYREVTHKRRGCILQVWWRHPTTNEVLPQGWCANQERQRIKAEKAASSQ